MGHFVSSGTNNLSRASAFNVLTQYLVAHCSVYDKLVCYYVINMNSAGERERESLQVIIYVFVIHFFDQHIKLKFCKALPCSTF